jgi:beta-galactosidase
MPEHAKAIAWYDHPFLGRWPAITENEFGAGTLLYEGTYLSDKLQTAHPQIPTFCPLSEPPIH